MQPSFSYPDIIDPETPTITRVFRRCQSSPGLIIFQDSQPEYTSLKDIIQVSSNSPPSPFWKRILQNRRKPQPCRCWNGEVLIKKVTKSNKKKKVIPILDDKHDDDDNQSALLTGTASSSLWYPPPPPPPPPPPSPPAIIISQESALLLCPNPKGLCTKRNQKKIHSEKCISCTSFISKKMFKELRNIFHRLSQRIGKIFSSMAPVPRRGGGHAP